MACTSVTIAGSPVAATKEIHREHNGLRRSHSCKDLCDHAGLRRSLSDPHLRLSLNLVRASSSEQRLKKSHSIVVPFPFSGSGISNSLRSFLFDSDTCKDMRLVDSEEREGEEEETEKDHEKRANWMERLMELRSHWINNRKIEEGEGEEGENEDEGCGVDYDTDNEEEPVVYDRESFSRFLDSVPWSEVKIFSQLAFLCNMAYVIPELKAEDLQRYYDLHFVTSSLEKKAEAAGIKATVDHDSVRVPEAPVKFSSVEPVESELKRPIRPSVAYEIAASAATYVHSRAKGFFLGSMPQEEIDDAVVPHGSLQPGEESGSKVYNSEVAAYVAASTMTAVVAAEETAKQEAARGLRSLHSCPCEWFICDDPSSSTRCFVIQGSDSLASWQANLFFEPTKFEGTEVMVHRGIYEAAKGIYEQFLPEIMNHLGTYGERARLRFTGHSLGGSLSLLVNLMLLARGVVKPSTLLPVVTFGSPFVFCGGHRILEDLGLDEGHVYSVMMHRDIVPRAFSCNYPNHVAQLLKRINGAFRSHPCLNSNKLLYSPLGQLFILQPDEKSSPPHPFLPPGSAFYALDKNQSSGVANALRVFLNTPHPIQTLRDPMAYGSEGTILRDHDSSNYLKAINGVLRQHTKLEVRKSRRLRLHHWWPLLTAPPHSWSHEGMLENSGLVTKEVVSGV